MMIAQFINAQDVMRGFVIDKDTHDPIIGATHPHPRRRL